MTRTIKTVKKTIKYAYYKNMSISSLESIFVNVQKGEYHADTKEIDLELSFMEMEGRTGKGDTFTAMYGNATQAQLEVQKLSRKRVLELTDDKVMFLGEALKKLADSGITSKLILQRFVAVDDNERKGEEATCIAKAREYFEKGKLTQEQLDLMIDLRTNYFLLDDVSDMIKYINDLLKK